MSRFRIASALILGLTLTAVASAKPIDLKEYYKKNESKSAFGEYINGKKIGWRIEESKIGTFEGKDVWNVSTVEVNLMQARGASYRTESKELTIYSLNGDGPIVYYEKTLLQNGKPIVTVARLKGKSLVITTKSDGQSRSRTVPLSKDTLREDIRLNAWTAADRKPGDKIETSVFDIDEPNAERKLSRTFIKRGQMVIDGVSTTVVHLTAFVDRAKAEIIAKLNGDAVEIRVGMMVIKRENEKSVKTLTLSALDSDFEIPVKKNIGDGRLIERLTLEVTGLRRREFPTSHRQRILSENNGVLTVETSRDFRDPSIKNPLTETQLKDVLEPTERIQSDDAAIRKLAREIVGTEKDPVKMATRLQSWVFRNLKKSYVITANTSKRVLENKAGKCTDHAMLFVALARSVKLPAREVIGLAFVPDPKRPHFGWHAWAEIHNGTRWVSVDPMWGELYVDATHIRFSFDKTVPAMMRKFSVSIKRAESNAAILGAMGTAEISHVAISLQSLKLLFRSLEQKLMTNKELGVELQRATFLIDLNLGQLKNLKQASMSQSDRRAVKKIVAIYQSLKVQIEALKAFSTNRNDAQKTKYEQAAGNVKKLLMNFGK